jgi:hypothetical protein
MRLHLDDEDEGREVSGQLPDFPVVVIHIEDPEGIAACCGLPWKRNPVERQGATLWFCTGCANTRKRTPIVGKVYELRWQHDEGYYPVAVFTTREEADRVAEGSWSYLEDPDDPWGHFAVVERDLVENTGEWARTDYIESTGEWDIADFFLPEPEEEE